jgi:hypothetical protein
MGFSNSGVKES